MSTAILPDALPRKTRLAFADYAETALADLTLWRIAVLDALFEANRALGWLPPGPQADRLRDDYNRAVEAGGRLLVLAGSSAAAPEEEQRAVQGAIGIFTRHAEIPYFGRSEHDPGDTKPFACAGETGVVDAVWSWIGEQRGARGAPPLVRPPALRNRVLEAFARPVGEHLTEPEVLEDRLYEALATFEEAAIEQLGPEHGGRGFRAIWTARGLATRLGAMLDGYKPHIPFDDARVIEGTTETLIETLQADGDPHDPTRFSTDSLVVQAAWVRESGRRDIRGAPPLQVRDELAAATRKVLEQLLPLPPEKRVFLRKRVLDHLQAAEVVAADRAGSGAASAVLMGSQGGPIDLDAARQIGRKLLCMVRALRGGDAPPFEHRLIQAAVFHYADVDDADPDFDGAYGFDTDRLVTDEVFAEVNRLRARRGAEPLHDPTADIAPADGVDLETAWNDHALWVLPASLHNELVARMKGDLVEPPALKASIDAHLDAIARAGETNMFVHVHLARAIAFRLHGILDDLPDDATEFERRLAQGAAHYFTREIDVGDDDANMYGLDDDLHIVGTVWKWLSKVRDTRTT